MSGKMGRGMMELPSAGQATNIRRAGAGEDERIEEDNDNK